MKPKRTRYYTMNSWNLSTAPAYNLKVHKVIPPSLQDKVFEMMDCEDFYCEINNLISDFNVSHNYLWQAGFNGRSGGYLVLYKGERKDNRILVYPGRQIEDDEVPKGVMKEFTQLANDIVNSVISMAKNCEVSEEEYIVKKTRKILSMA